MVPLNRHQAQSDFAKVAEVAEVAKGAEGAEGAEGADDPRAQCAVREPDMLKSG